MNNNIYDLSRFSLLDATERLIRICNTYDRMCLDSNLDYENQQLKKELEEAIPFLKKEVISKINDL